MNGTVLRMRRICLALGAFAVLLVSPASVFAWIATPLFDVLGTEDGLPSRTVNKLVQDRAGYVWIGTADGLARYDGVTFHLYQHDPDDPASLPGNSIETLHVDAQDRLWVGVEGSGLSMLDADRRGFRHFRAADDARFALADVWAIASASDGSLWFGGYGGGLYRFAPDSGAVSVLRHDSAHPEGLASDYVLALAFDRDGALWIGSDKGLQRLSDDTFTTVPPPACEPASMVMSLAPQDDGTLWVGTRTGLQRVDRAGRRVRVASSDPQLTGGVHSLVSDRGGSLWLGTHSGISLMDTADAPAALARPVWGQGQGFDHRRPQSVMDVLEDHEGGLWFAAPGFGVLRVPPQWRNFAALRQGAVEHGGLAAGRVRGVAHAADDALWFVADEGLLQRVDAAGRVEPPLDAPDAFPSAVMRSALEIDGALWIGFQHGLGRYDPTTKRLQHWPADAGPLAPPRGIVDLLRRAPDGSVWLSANGGGLQHRAPDGRVLGTYPPGADAGVPAPDTEDIAFAPDGAVWIAGDAGLHRFDAGERRFERVPGAPQQRVFGLAFAPDGTLWMQRLGALEHFEHRQGHLHLLRRVDARDGFPALEVGGVVLDGGGDVWMTSARGLWRYSPEDGRLRRYGVRDGLVHQEFVETPPLRRPDGTIVAPTMRGVVLFDPSRIAADETAPRLAIERIDVRREGEIMGFDPGLSVTLQHGDRELHVQARLFSFVDPLANRYRFRLDGYEPDWIDAGSAGERVFSQLPAGSYRLQTQGANAAGVWSAPREIPIRVLPPWWNTPWAWGAYAVGAGVSLLAAAGLYRRRIARRHAAELADQERRLALQASDAKTSFLATMGHEIRTPMTGVLGMTELLLRTPLEARQRGYAEAIQRSGELMLRLVNDALDLARIEAGKLDLVQAPLDLHLLLHDVHALLRALAERKGLALRVQIHHGAPRHVLGDPLRLRQILLNLGNNALKFTEQGGVDLTLEAAADPFNVAFVVRDTGPGLNAEQCARLFRRFEQADGAATAQRYGGSGLGLAICQELAAAMGGHIAVTSTPGHGCTFVVRMSLPPAAPAATSAIAVDLSASSSLQTPPSAKRILLVEDDVTVAAVVRELLEAQGHTVVHAPHGLAALAELDVQEIDLAFVDLDLPGLDGLALASLIRSRGYTLPLVALTARADAGAEPAAAAAGMRAFLRKPVSGAQLEAAVRQVTSDGSARRG